MLQEAKSWTLLELAGRCGINAAKASGPKADNDALCIAEATHNVMTSPSSGSQRNVPLGVVLMSKF